MDKISYIGNVNGAQVIFVNGKALDGVAYITYLTENNCYEDFSNAGYKLFSFPVFFGYRMLNEMSQLPVFTLGIFDGMGPNFSWFDRDVEKILKACPDAYIFPRVNISLPERWENANPDELNYTGTDKFPESRRPCFASDEWAKEVKKELKLFIEHVQSMPYAQHFVGYQIAAGNTEEWFCYDQKGGIGKRFDEKFKEKFPHSKPCIEDEDYLSMISDVTADRICEFAGYIKELTEHKYIVGSFYGYTLELSSPILGHHALNKVLNCDDIDFLCSPMSYTNVRKPGNEHPLMVPIDSLKLHNKLYFSENDTRTHLSKAVVDTPHYTSPIWFGPETEEQSLDVMKMHFSKSLIKGHACWWFDMWGGWYKTDAYMAFMKKAKEVYHDAMSMSFESVAEVAVIVDEKSYLKPSTPAVKNGCANYMRHILAKTGTPSDIYLAKDFGNIDQKRYKAFIVLEPAETELTKAIKNELDERKVPVLSVNEANYTEINSVLKDFYKSNGVTVYTESEVVFNRNKSHIFVHGIKDTTVNIKLPDGKKLYEIFEDKEYKNCFELKFGQSKLFKII